MAGENLLPWLLAEANDGSIKQCPHEVAVLPLGAREPRNLCPTYRLVRGHDDG